jgi:hypothetical protein
LSISRSTSASLAERQARLVKSNGRVWEWPEAMRFRVSHFLAIG